MLLSCARSRGSVAAAAVRVYNIIRVPPKRTWRVRPGGDRGRGKKKKQPKTTCCGATRRRSAPREMIYSARTVHARISYTGLMCAMTRFRLFFFFFSSVNFFKPSILRAPHALAKSQKGTSGCENYTIIMYVRYEYVYTHIYNVYIYICVYTLVCERHTVNNARHVRSSNYVSNCPYRRRTTATSSRISTASEGRRYGMCVWGNAFVSYV